MCCTWTFFGPLGVSQNGITAQAQDLSTRVSFALKLTFSNISGVRFGLSRRAWAAAIADAAGGWAVHSQAHAQSLRRDAVRPVGGEPVFSVLLRRSGVPPRGAVRSLVANALATATGRGADCRAAAGEPFGGASDGGDREQRSRARGGGHHRAGEGDCASDRCAAHPPGDREARRDGQTRGRRATPELSARGQTRGHYGGALYACPPVQARSAATQIPAHATWPHHPRRSPQDRGRCCTAGSLWSAARSCIAGSPSRAAPARTEGLLMARPRGG